ncbi:hypothetical protein, partial [Bacillus sp. SIMBA_033]
VAAFLPVLPLFVLFGYQDEARNFSIAFPAIVLIALHGATRFEEIFCGGTREVLIHASGHVSIVATADAEV